MLRSASVDLTARAASVAGGEPLNESALSAFGTMHLRIGAPSGSHRELEAHEAFCRATQIREVSFITGHGQRR